jgi:hypothetical protein
VPTSLVSYFEGSRCNAIAHAFPRGGAEILDPDDPIDFARLSQDVTALEKMLRMAIEERWEYPVYALHE